ncbi:MAG: DUF4173 domain-containing protein [Pseudomonadota bacterium]
MKQAILRGVPLAMKRDGWWLGPIEHSYVPAPRTRNTWWLGPGVLLAMIALGDVLVWQTRPGISLALFGALLGAAVLALSGLKGRQLALAAGGVAFSLLPLVELVQPLSILIWLMGLSLTCAFAAGLRRPQLIRAALRFFWVAPWSCLTDAAGGARKLVERPAPKLSVAAALMNWAVPLGLGAVFALLIVGANPVLDGWLTDLSRLQVDLPEAGRVVFWALLALLIWPCLHVTRLTERLRPAPPRQTVRRPGLINPQSVSRSLVLFNALFAVQTVMDAALLGGEGQLPDGMTYATYAHRGAYPLLVTALLAGGFAVLANPYADRPLIRAMLLVWIAQTLALVAASVVRLEIYVDVYGLTRLRLAAFIWMGVVATGLAITFAQVASRQNTAWMLARCGLLGAVTLYVCAFFNFDGAIARYNLNQPVPLDAWYVCQLSEGAVPEITAWQAARGRTLCTYTSPSLHTPLGWYEWGFRNARLRHSLAGMEQPR